MRQPTVTRQPEDNAFFSFWVSRWARGCLTLHGASAALLLVIASFGVGCTVVSDATEAPRESPQCPPDEGPSCSTVAWVGDTLLADAALPALQENGYEYPFEFVEDLLLADLTIGNAEGPITVITEPYNEGQTWSYHADPEAASALASVGFDALSLANNHLNDRGPDGIVDTLFHLSEVGVASFGGGLDRGEALAPFLFEAPAGLVAVFGFGKNSQWVPPAGTGAGQLLLSSNNITAAIEVADSLEASFRIAFPHWGSNYSVVSQQQRDQAQLFIDAGFDLVIGHGPHNQQGVEIIDGVPVLWSLGNFAFGTPGRWDDAFPGFGLVAHTEFGESGLEAITLTCLSTDNDIVQFQPRPCDTDIATEVIGALGDAVEVVDGLGQVMLTSP